MRPTHGPDNSHHVHAANAHNANATRNAGTNGGGLMNSSKLTMRPDVRLFAALIAIGVIATGICVRSFSVEASSAPIGAANSAKINWASPSFGGVMNTRLNLPLTNYLQPDILTTGTCSGTRNIPGDYATLAAAITDISANGVVAGGGGCTLNVVPGNPQIAPAGGYSLNYAANPSTALDPLIITGNGNTITAGVGVSTTIDAIFKLIGADYVTLQGFTMQESVANVTATTQVEWGVALLYASTTNGAQNNTIQNNTITLNKTNLNSFGIYSNTRHAAGTPTTTADITNNTTGPNSGNKVYNNIISNVNLGIAFIGSGTAANQDVGNDIGGVAAGTGNTISNWGGAAATSSYVSNSGSIYCIFMNHQVGENVSYNTITSATLSGTAVTTRGIFKDYTTTGATIVGTTNITNNTITITDNFTSGTLEIIRSQGTVPSTSTLNVNNNTILNSSVGGAASSTTFVGIVNSEAVGTLSMSNNIIRGTTSTATTGGFTGVSNTATVGSTINLNSNQIGNSTSGAITFSAATSGAVTGITNTGGASAASLSMNSNNIQGIVHSVAGSSAHTYITWTHGNSVTDTINLNTFTNLNVNTTGSVNFLTRGTTSMTATGVTNITNNSIVTGFNKGGAGSTVTFLNTGAGDTSPAGAVFTETGNNFSNVTLTGATTVAGWSDLNGPSGGGVAKTITGNTFSNISTGSASVQIIAQNFGGNGTTVSNNTISNVTHAPTVTALMLTGINIGSSSGGATHTVANNVISGLSSTGTGGQNIGILGGSTTITTLNIRGNTVSGISSTSTAGPVVSGIFNNATGTTVNISKNKVYDVVCSPGAVIGINSTASAAGNTINVSNNIVGRLYASTSLFFQAARGLLLQGTVAATFNVYFNTVYLDGTTPTQTYCVYIGGATANVPNVNAIDNIFVNNVTSSNGSALPNTVYFRFGTTTATNLAATTNNNLLYGGTPAVDHLIYVDGTVAALTNPQQTLASYQAFVTPRESASKTELPPFLNTTNGSLANYLHISTLATQVSNGGIPIIGFTDDFDGDTRDASTPDIGADEITTIQFSSSTYTVAENVGGGVATITVTRTAGTGNAATVNYATSDGSATGGASCSGFPVDYVNASGTLSFAAGETSKTFDVTICNDAVFEGNETVNLSLNTPTGSILGTPNTATLTIVDDEAPVYTWTGTASSDWQVPLNWSPARLVPLATDVLIINGTTTPSPIITNVPTQTIAALRLINGASATLNASAVAPPQTLTINGATGTDLTVPAGNFLTLDGSNGLTIKVSGAGTLGTIGGGVAAQGGFHRLFGDAGGGITFQSGGIGTAGPGLTSNMFGTGAVGDGDAGSVIFANGSFYFHNAGGSPFGVSPNPAVVVFQTGSLATFLTASGFEANGRTYANLAIGKVDPGGVAVNASDSGTGNFQFDRLAVNSTGTTNSSLTYNGSGASAINIRERIDSNGVGNGGTLPDVILTAGSGGIVMNNPSTTVVFGNDGSNTRGVEFESSASVGPTTELLLNRKLLVGISQPSSFVLTVDGVLNGSATGYVIGNVKRPVTTAETFIYHVGTPNGYSPLDADFTAGTGDLTVVARQGAQPVLTSATSLQRYWTLTEGGAVTADLTFHYNSPDVMGTEANYRLVIVESGNATSFPENCPNVACVDESANTIKRTGVITFSDWTAAEPAAPTAVKLNSFSATRSGDEVKLQWQTGYEVRNLGYNIYREQDGKRVQITPSLVAGSALVAGNGTRLTAGLSYSWYDQVPGGQKAEGRRQQAENGRLSAVDGPPSVTYWLEDVDLNGTRTLHGPIAVAECGMENGDCLRISERSKLLGEIANPQSAIRNSKLNDGVQLRSWPAATTAPDSHDAEPDPVEMQRTIAGMTGLKVSVSRAGWYRITQPEVLAAGLDIADANGLQLYRDGRQVAFRLSNSSEQFGPADYLEFYGEGLDSATATAQTYYLVKLAEPGKRVEVKPMAVDPADRVNSKGFAYTVQRKERMTYFSALLNGDTENFFGQIVTSTGATAAMPVNHFDATTQSAGTPAQLEVALQGVTHQSHLVQVRINGADLGTINFANTGNQSQTFSVPAAALHDGNNNVELTSLGGAADVSLVDVLRLTYMRSYVADNNALAFTLNNRQPKRITGFTTNDVRVVDVTDPSQPVELTPHVSPDGDGFAALVGLGEVRVPFNGPHKLLAFVQSQAETADALRLNQPSSWWSETVGADYVMISNGTLKQSLEPLAQLHRKQGMVVRVVDVEDLYDEFTYGEHSPRAIHDFLERAMSTWTRQPHYVLFAGDASYDPKNYLGQGLNDLVPTKLIDTALTETASDDWLADFNADGIADLASGRLPVRTVAETEALVSKFIDYEDRAPDPSRGALLVADTSFEGASSAVESLLPAGLPVQSINRAGAIDATTHNQIIASLNEGPLVANYYGHGSNGVWTGAPLLSSNDAPALANTKRLSVFTMMTCFNGYFQDAYNDSLSEALLKSKGGAVAVWASTTLTEPAGQNVIGAEFYRLLFGPQPITLGDAARSA